MALRITKTMAQRLAMGARTHGFFATRCFSVLAQEATSTTMSLSCRNGSVLEDQKPKLCTAPSHSKESLSNIQLIQSTCHARVPGWSSLPAQDIRITQLSEGLSNQNFKVWMDRPGVPIKGVLYRVYGKDAAKLYDTSLEFRIVTMLSNYQIAPRIYAFGDGWRIEEWHDAVPLANRNMRNPANMAQVAAHIGNLHKISSRDDFPRDFKEMPPLSLQRLSTWSDAFEEAAPRVLSPQRPELNVKEVLAERDWLVSLLQEGAEGSSVRGLDTVFSHWDGQENNILQTLCGMRFIDFEYSGMDDPAFDVSVYFIECMIDYLHGKYPFYAVRPDRYPNEWEQRLFCSIYLSQYLEHTVRSGDAVVTDLLQRVQRFTLVNHLLWSIWSVIRADQLSASTGFDFVHYAQTRWQLYKFTKKALYS